MPAFRPNASGTATIAATAASANVALLLPGKGAFQIRIANYGAKGAFIEFGTSNAVAATLSSIPILPGTVEVLTVGGDSVSSPITYVAAICNAAETTTLYFTTGAGD